MVLSNLDIYEELSKGHLRIDSYDGLVDLEKSIQPASVDLHLSRSFSILTRPKFNVYGRRVPVQIFEEEETIEYATNEFTIKPNRFVLASTMERLVIPDYLVARLEGRSSIGRKGLFIHNAGFIDPGFDGEITLELFNCTERPIIVKSGMRICQVVFEYLHTPTDKPYNGKYQGQYGATASRLHLDFDR